MSTFPRQIINPVLKEAVELKIGEVAQATANLKRRYDENATIMAAGGEPLERVANLLDQIKQLDPYLEDGDDLDTMTRYLEQAKDDRSISHTKLQKFEKQLLDKLAVYYRRLDVSFLHISLIKEAINKGTDVSSVSANLEKATLDDEFDLVEGDDLEFAFEKFEKSAFTAKPVDTEELEKYLTNLFPVGAGKFALDRLRDDVEEYGKDVIDGHDELENDFVECCIEDLLKNSVLSEEKKKALQGYLESPASISELTSLLNVKSVRNWNWRDPQNGLPVTARQNSEGKYCIAIDEDTVDMLFLHCLSVGWCMKIKDFLYDVIGDTLVWPRNREISREDTAKRDYYLSPRPRRRDPQHNPGYIRHHGPPPPPPHPGYRGPPGPPPPPPMGHVPPMGYVPPPPPPPVPYGPPPPVWNSRSKKGKKIYNRHVPPLGHVNLHHERYFKYNRDFFLSRLPKRYGSRPEFTSINDTQAELMKHLAAEARIREALDGEVHGVVANFHSFASSLPHKTILTILKFIAVPKIWLDVFTRFLEAPLNMGPLVRGASDQILTRTNGIPAGHGIELFFSELVFFFLDFVVYQKTKGYLYRLQDKCYFVGAAEQCKEVHEIFGQFANVTSLDVTATFGVDEAIGLVNFGIQAGEPITFKVDNAKVEAYAHRVKKQLATCNTVIEWIRIWNLAVGKYAPHLFGPLANVFGAAHLEAVTQAYNTIHSIIFGSSNLTSYVKSLLAPHISSGHLNSTTLEPLIFLPFGYGGLGVKNPYTTLSIARNMSADPQSPLTTFLSEEKAYYEKASEVFASFAPETRAEKLTLLPPMARASLTTLFETRAPDTFMTMEEFTKHREQLEYPFLAPKEKFGPPYQYMDSIEIMNAPPSLFAAYKTLIDEPRDLLEGSNKVGNEAKRLGWRAGARNWFSMSGEERWAVQMYGDECFELYDGLEMWSEEHVPTQALKILRGYEEAVDDDTSSVSSYA